MRNIYLCVIGAGKEKKRKEAFLHFDTKRRHEWHKEIVHAKYALKGERKTKEKRAKQTNMVVKSNGDEELDEGEQKEIKIPNKSQFYFYFEFELCCHAFVLANERVTRI